jgi:broad specificity phosphatase PhoE
VELTLVRHGQSTANRDGILQGRFDAPLSDLGRLQATQLGAWFRRQSMVWDAVYCSPLRRARDTALLITTELGRAPAVEEPDLAELHAGDLQEKSGAVLRRDYPSFYERGVEGLGDYSEFGGESYDDVQERVRRLIEALTERHRAGEQRVLMVSHGGLLFQLAKALTCRPVPRVSFLRFSNCSATRLQLRERRGIYIGEIEWHVPLELIGGEASGGAAALLY